MRESIGQENWNRQDRLIRGRSLENYVNSNWRKRWLSEISFKNIMLKGFALENLSFSCLKWSFILDFKQQKVLSLMIRSLKLNFLWLSFVIFAFFLLFLCMSEDNFANWGKRFLMWKQLLISSFYFLEPFDQFTLFLLK